MHGDGDHNQGMLSQDYLGPVAGTCCRDLLAAKERNSQVNLMIHLFHLKHLCSDLRGIFRGTVKLDKK